MDLKTQEKWMQIIVSQAMQSNSSFRFWKCTYVPIILLSFGDLQKLLEKHLSEVAILCILNRWLSVTANNWVAKYLAIADDVNNCHEHGKDNKVYT